MQMRLGSLISTTTHHRSSLPLSQEAYNVTSTNRHLSCRFINRSPQTVVFNFHPLSCQWKSADFCAVSGGWKRQSIFNRKVTCTWRIFLFRLRRNNFHFYRVGKPIEDNGNWGQPRFQNARSMLFYRKKSEMIFGGGAKRINFHRPFT